MPRCFGVAQQANPNKAIALGEWADVDVCGREPGQIFGSSIEIGGVSARVY